MRTFTIIQILCVMRRLKGTHKMKGGCAEKGRSRRKGGESTLERERGGRGASTMVNLNKLRLITYKYFPRPKIWYLRFSDNIWFCPKQAQKWKKVRFNFFRDKIVSHISYSSYLLYYSFFFIMLSFLLFFFVIIIVIVVIVIIIIILDFNQFFELLLSELFGRDRVKSLKYFIQT